MVNIVVHSHFSCFVNGIFLRGYLELCDPLWWNPSDIRYAIVCAYCIDGSYCGLVTIGLDYYASSGYWVIGASCDHLWRYNVGIRYVLVAGSVHGLWESISEYCGTFRCSLGEDPGNVNWYFGAIVIIFGVFSLMFGMLILVLLTLTNYVVD